MLTKKEIFIIILYIIGYFAAIYLIAWLIISISPFFIAAIVFIPWLIAALKDGAKVSFGNKPAIWCR